MTEAIIRAAAAARVLPGHVSVLWQNDGRSITFVRDAIGWFWAAHGRPSPKLLGSGRAATIEAAIEQASEAKLAINPCL